MLPDHPVEENQLSQWMVLEVQVDADFALDQGLVVLRSPSAGESWVRSAASLSVRVTGNPENDREEGRQRPTPAELS